MSLFPEMEGSTSSQQDLPVKTFQLQEVRQESKQIEVDSFSRLPDFPMRSMPIAELDRHLCWRTYQTSLLEQGEVGQEPYTESWPAEGIVLNGKLWGQKMWEHLTGGKDGGQSRMWPTPTARDWRSGKAKTQAERGRLAGPSLAEVSGGCLNAEWVEWLMGYPIGWTNLETSPE